MEKTSPAFDTAARFTDLVNVRAQLLAATAARNEELASDRSLWSRMVDKVSNTPSEKAMKQATSEFERLQQECDRELPNRIIRQMYATMGKNGDDQAIADLNDMMVAKNSRAHTRTVVNRGKFAIDRLEQTAEAFYGASDSEKLDALVSNPGFSAMSSFDEWAANVFLGEATTAVASFRNILSEDLKSQAPENILPSGTGSREGLDTLLDFGVGGPLDIVSFLNVGALNKTAKSIVEYRNSIAPIVDHAQASYDQACAVVDQREAKFIEQYGHYRDAALETVGPLGHVLDNDFHLVPEKLPAPRPPLSDMLLSRRQEQASIQPVKSVSGPAPSSPKPQDRVSGHRRQH